MCVLGSRGFEYIQRYIQRVLECLQIPRHIQVNIHDRMTGIKVTPSIHEPFNFEYNSQTYIQKTFEFKTQDHT